MTGLNKALYALAAQSNMPTYLQGCVPQDRNGAITAAYPFVTFQPIRPESNETALFTVQAWVRDDAEGNKKRAEIVDRFEEIVPAGGKLFVSNGCRITVHRAAQFAQYIQDPDDRQVKGVRIMMTVRLLTL